MKKIVVACASGVATSQAVASKVNRLLKENSCGCSSESSKHSFPGYGIKRQCGIYFHYKNDKGISGSGN